MKYSYILIGIVLILLFLFNCKVKQPVEKPILKQYGELKVDDFKKNPVWIACHIIDYDEDWYDETDEETFRPWNKKVPMKGTEYNFLLKSKFVFNDNSVHNGFINYFPNGQSEFRINKTQPLVLLENGYSLLFYYGMFPKEKEVLKAVINKTGKNENDIFPIKVTVENGLLKSELTGIIDGFYYIDKESQLRRID